MRCTYANCAAKSNPPIGAQYSTHPDGPKLHVFWQMVPRVPTGLEHPGAKHPGIVFDQNLKLSHSPNAIVSVLVLVTMM